MKLVAASQGRKFTVTPVPEIDPDFTVTIHELTEDETNSIYDKFKFLPGSNKNTMRKLSQVVKEQAIESVDSWENAFGADGLPLECTKANKLLLLSTEVEVDGEATTIWQRAAEKVAEARAEAAKN